MTQKKALFCGVAEKDLLHYIQAYLQQFMETIKSNMMEDNDYSPPMSLAVLNHILKAPRREYTTDISVLLSDDGRADSYRMGLIFVASLFAGTLFVWALILLLFKFNRHAVGCASGSSFISDEEVHREIRWSRDGKGTDRSRDDDDSRDDGDSSFHSSIPSEEDDELAAYGYDMDVDSVDSNDSIFEPSTREWRTQIAFFFFGLVVLGCVPLVHTFAFLPMRQSSGNMSRHIQESDGILDELSSSLRAISTGISGAFSILEVMPFSEEVVCPQVNQSDIEGYLGFRVEAMIEVYLAEYRLVESDVAAHESDAWATLDLLSDMLDILKEGVKESENYVWVVPGVLLGLCALTPISIFGAFLSWKRDSNRRLQRFLSLTILPMLILTSTTCWSLTMAASVSSAAIADVCIGEDKSDGSPLSTIQKVLHASTQIQGGTELDKFVEAYASGCESFDPTVQLAELQENLTNVVDRIWEQLSAVDLAGRAELEELCGEDNMVQPFLAGMRDLARQLTSASRGLDSATSSLSCDRIASLYKASVDGTLCTKLAGASSLGFYLFFMLSLSTMTLVSLRASWFYNIGDDKIYDESEVAENMIVNEHEEYLAYISKYRHEWEEYGGFDTALPEQQTMPDGSLETGSVSESLDEDSSSGFSEESPRQNSDTTPPHGEKDVDCRKQHEKEAFDPYNLDDGQSRSSINSEDISFLSLSDIRTPQNVTSGEGSVPQAPPSLLGQENGSVTSAEGESLPPPMLPPGKFLNK